MGERLSILCRGFWVYRPGQVARQLASIRDDSIAYCQGTFVYEITVARDDLYSNLCTFLKHKSELVGTFPINVIVWTTRHRKPRGWNDNSQQPYPGCCWRRSSLGGPLSGRYTVWPWQRGTYFCAVDREISATMHCPKFGSLPIHRVRNVLEESRNAH